MICEPASIVQVAEWMSENRWLDMRTPMGRAQRVKVVRLTVYATRDEIELLQEWFNATEKIQRRTFVFDAEECWDCKATTVGLLDVKPLEGRTHEEIKPPEPAVSAADAQVISDILDSTCFVFGQERKDLEATQYRHPTTHYRHMTILAIFEMTNLSGADICKEVFGYASPMPFQSASFKIHARTEKEGARVAVKKIGDAADARIKHWSDARFRRTASFPADYSPVLER